MAALHTALQSLAPVDFSQVPSSVEGLEGYLAELQEQGQTIVESIPIVDPAEGLVRPRAKTVSSVASNASEISASAARSEPPPAHISSLQKEWGKPLKLKPAENELGISVYKMTGKDGRGAWFARRSVHEGLGFTKFKAALEKEFPTSLAVQGAPGEGNVRGIGAETRLERIDVPNRGSLEVYRLTAQFPGPTAPRDFVTFLVTSSNAMKAHGDASELIPRHYMVISKPCNHPDSQPRHGFIRGQYESVEFIREVPRRLKASASQTNLGLAHVSHAGHQKHSHDMAQDLLIRNAQKIQTGMQDGGGGGGGGGGGEQQNEGLAPPLHHVNSRSDSPASGRRRSHTVGAAEHLSRRSQDGVEYDPEDNPVEWIMVTRSDPGGSVPRFLVERGTPASICADAYKFLDWACQLDDDVPSRSISIPRAFRRESFTSFENEERSQRLDTEQPVINDPEHEPLSAGTAPTSRTNTSELSTRADTTDSATSRSSGLAAPASGTPSKDGPLQVASHVLTAATVAQVASHTKDSRGRSRTTLDDDLVSIVSTVSWASAESHVSSDDVSASQSSPSMTKELTSASHLQQHQHQQILIKHEKERQKILQHRDAQDKKLAKQREKLDKLKANATDKDQATLKKSEEKYERELKKTQERHERDIKKLEQRKKKDIQRVQAKQQKQAEKDERDTLRRERDEAAKKLQVVEQERDLWMKQVAELKKENTALMARIAVGVVPSSSSVV